MDFAEYAKMVQGFTPPDEFDPTPPLPNWQGSGVPNIPQIQMPQPAPGGWDMPLVTAPDRPALPMDKIAVDLANLRGSWNPRYIETSRGRKLVEPPPEDDVFGFTKDGEPYLKDSEAFAIRYGQPLPGISESLKAAPATLMHAVRKSLFETAAMTIEGMTIEGRTGKRPEALKRLSEEAKQSMIESIPPGSEYLEGFRGGISPGAISAGHSVPYAALGGAGIRMGTKTAAEVALAGMALGAKANAYYEYLDKGYSPMTSHVLSTISGGIEYGTEKIAFPALVEKWGKNWPEKLVKYIGLEIGQEIPAETAQAAMDKLTTDPDMTMAEFGERLEDMLYALPTAMGVNIATVKGLQVAVEDIPRIALARHGVRSSKGAASKAAGHEMQRQIQGIDIPPEVAEASAIDIFSGLRRPGEISPMETAHGEQIGPPMPAGVRAGYSAGLASYAIAETPEYQAGPEPIFSAPYEMMQAIAPVMDVAEKVGSVDPLTLNVAAAQRGVGPLNIPPVLERALNKAMEQIKRPISTPTRTMGWGLGHGEVVEAVKTPDGWKAQLISNYRTQYEHVEDIASFPNEISARAYVKLIDEIGEMEEATPRGQSDRIPVQDLEKFTMAGGFAPRTQAALSRKRINPKKDNIRQAIIKLGGISKDQAEGHQIDYQEQIVGVGTLVRQNPYEGRTLDDLALALDEYGYPVRNQRGEYDPNVLAELIRTGEEVYTPEGAEARAEQAFEEMEGDRADMEAGIISYDKDVYKDIRGLEPGHYTVQPGEYKTFNLSAPTHKQLLKDMAWKASAEQSGLLNQAISDIVSAGFPSELAAELNYITLNRYKDAYGTIYPTIRTIAVREDLLENLADAGYLKTDEEVANRHLRAVLAHEMSHYLDMGEKGEPASSRSRLFEVNVDKVKILYETGNVQLTDRGALGPVMQEAVFAYFRDYGGLNQYLNYPLGGFPSAVLAIQNAVSTEDLASAGAEMRRLKAEVFAQLGALYYTHRTLMEKYLPLALRMMEEVNGNIQNTTGVDVADKVSESFQRIGPIGGIESYSGPGGQAAEGLGYWEQRPSDRAGGTGRPAVLGKFEMAPHGQGRRVVSRKFKREKKTGRYVGAPDWVGSSPQKLGVLTRILTRLAREGEPGRYWYEDSSRAILNLVGGDIGQAEKVVALIAIYSPNATVPANTTMALTAYYQWLAGVPINAGFTVADAKAQNLLDNNEYWSGIKTNSFYQNLMVEIDPSKLDPGAATMDMWMAIAADYGTKVLDQGPKYKFMETMINNIASNLGWHPHQVQAAIWTATKGRVDPIRPLLQEEEIKKGIGRFVKKTDPKTGKEKDVYEIVDKKAHYRLAHKLGMAYDLKPEDIETSKYDFSHALEASGIMLSWEATPGKSTGILPGIHAASTARKMEYLNAIHKVIAPEGNNIIAEMAGLPQGETLFGYSAWEGDIGAGAQTLTSAPMGDIPTGGKPKKLRGVKPEARKLLNLYSGLKATLLDQEAVVWHTPVFDKVMSRNNGALLDYGRPLSEDEMNALYQALYDEFNTWDLAPGYTSTGVRILNFTDLGNVEFHDRLDIVLDKLRFKGHHGAFRSDGAYVRGDYTDPNQVRWEIDPYGKNPQMGTLAGLSPDIQERYADLRSSIVAVQKDFIDRYGWDKEEELISFSIEGAEAAGTRLDTFLNNLNSEEDAKQLFMDVVRDNESRMAGARRDVVPVEQMQQLAVELGWDANDVIESKRFFPEEFEAARIITDQALTELKSLAKKAVGGTDEDVLAYQNGLQRFIPLAETMLGMRAEWGRVGVMMQQQAASARQIKAILDSMGGREVPEASAAVIADMEARGADNSQIGKVARKAQATRRVDQFLEIWYAFLLSGLRTHAVNSTSNALVAIWTLPEHFLAGVIGKLHSGEKVYLRETVYRSIGMINGVRDGATLANEIIRNEMPMGRFIAGNLEKILGVDEGRKAFIEEKGDVLAATLGQKVEGQPRIAHVPGKIGKVIRSPLTMLSVEDALFQMTGQRMELYAMAARQALKEGAPSVSDRVNEIVAKTDALIGVERPKIKDMTPEDEVLWQIYDDAWQAGKYQTFTNQLGEAGQYATRGANRFPIPARLVVPFIRTPTNIVKFFGHRTPFAAVMPSFWEMYNRGGAFRDIALARVLFGSAVSAFVFTLALAGKITGGGPGREEQNKRRLWREKYEPYSWLHGDTYYSFNRLEPIGMLFGVSADTAYLWEYASSGEKEEIAGLIHAAVMRNLMSKTWVTGLSEAVNAFYDPERYGKKYISRLLSTVVPTVVSHIAQTGDPYLRRVDGLLDAIRSRIPGQREKLVVHYNVWGQPITYGGILGPDMISFIYMGQDPKDPVVDSLLELGKYPSMPQNKINGVELTPEQFNEYVMMRGRYAKAQLDNKVTSEAWKIMSPWRKEAQVDKVFRDATSLAKKAMSVLYPEIPTEDDVRAGKTADQIRQDAEMVIRLIDQGNAAADGRLMPPALQR